MSSLALAWRGVLMKLKIAYRLVGLAVVMTLSGVALAQSGREDGIPDKAMATKLPPGERLTKAQKMVTTMKKSLVSVEALLEKTRTQSRDLQKINCINEKLVSIKGYVKVSEKSYIDLKDANERQDSEASVHHYTLVAISDSKVERLSGDARLCVGDVAQIDDSTERQVTVDPDIADFRPIAEGGRIVVEPANPLEFIELLDRLPELTPIQ